MSWVIFDKIRIGGLIKLDGVMERLLGNRLLYCGGTIEGM